DKQAALTFLKKAMKRYGAPKVIVTDRLRSYGAAMKEIGNVDRHINRRSRFKNMRNAALSEWRQLLETRSH
ncbi:MAG: DDE-type integrase/transposase/recombinase, partial [Henriciella sp.]|nr:DDE-type integrase/transposase/recombinase [Henriciella sp.]